MTAMSDTVAVIVLNAVCSSGSGSLMIDKDAEHKILTRAKTARKSSQEAKTWENFEENQQSFHGSEQKTCRSKSRGVIKRCE